jgi:hypothetical protein
MESAESKSIASLKQRRFPFGSREVSISSDNNLIIKEKSLLRRDETQIPLEILQSSPAYSKTFSLKWLINTLLLLALTWVIYTVSERFSVPAINLVTLIFFAASLYAAYQFFYRTSNLVIYRNAYTNENYLYLWNNLPNKTTFEDFLNKLNTRIDGFEMEKAKSPAEKIELYSQHLAFLHSENILTNEELSRLSKKVYEKALDMDD